jgi:DNA modification methylase
MPATKKTKMKKPDVIPAGKVKKPAAPKSAGGKKARAAKPTPAAETPAPPKQTTVNITAAKGRPMLSWVGKRPLRHVTAFPAQHIESFNPAGEPVDKGGLLFHGDNKEVLAHLLANGFRGKVNLIYIDPPFDSGADYVRKVSLRGMQGMAKLAGESYTLGEQIQYTDIWANDNYLQFMFERLMLLKELLTDDGSFFLHCDYRRIHHFRCLLDEVFGSGEDNFVNEIIWQHQIMGGSHEKRFPKAHETILWYSKGGSKLRSDDPEVRVPFSDYVLNTMEKDEDGRWYYERRRMSRKATAAEAASKAHTRTYVDNPEGGTVAADVWDDMPSYQELTNERQGLELYPTQKTTKLLTRLIAAASDPGDLVLDCFLGSGTTAVVAQELGRKWIGCDINKGAIQNAAKRLEVVIKGQITAAKEVSKQTDLIADDSKKSPTPAQLSFAVHRVNDYDLAIQHNEAVNLACEHIGITRTRSDSFFDGSIGQRLAKIIPFGHPLSVPDLEDLKKELSARPNEERDVVVVCLGKELTVDAWLADWNRLRKRGDVPNKIEIIELRTDPKYGKFIAHQPARAKVDIARKADKLVVEIKDFISPSIIERLQSQAGLLQPKIDDWRAMVDCVMIDPAHDGKVFNIALADVPEKKTDFVQARYELDAPKGKTTVAVKITDMLGEEVVVTKEV